MRDVNPLVKFTPETDVDPVVETRSWADRLGIVLSGLCVIHCAATPLLFLVLPAFQVAAYHTYFHDVLLIVLPVLAFVAFIPGYRRHRDIRVFLWGAAGIVFISLGALVFEGRMAAEVVLSITGSVLLIRAHLMNRKLCACCGPSGHSHGSAKRLVGRFKSSHPDRN